MSRKILPPQPSRLLYENLFGHKNRALTLQRLSDGLKATIENAGFVLADAKHLAQADRFARATSIATAEEEMAKAYILLDACSLDFLTLRGNRYAAWCGGVFMITPAKYVLPTRCA